MCPRTSDVSEVSAGVVVLGSIISTRSGVPLDSYAATWLFTPLGIQNVEWRRSPDGHATGGGGMRLRPRDMAKFGNLYVNGGVVVVTASNYDSTQNEPGFQILSGGVLPAVQ